MDRRMGALAGSFIGAQVIVFYALLWPLREDNWLTGFRNYFSNDQLSYSAIATAASRGRFFVEPLTESGSSFYPSAWYYFMGIVGGITGIPIVTLWQVLGLLAVATAIAVLGAVAYRVSHFTFAPLLPAIAILTGTLSTVFSDNWFTSLNSHAVIWGPFGTLFPLNGESVGLMLGGVALALLLLATQIGPKPRVIYPAVIILGLLANIQTYSFFSATTLAGFFVAILALKKLPSRNRLLTSAALIALVLLSGRFVAEIIGPLPLLVLLMLALLPAAWPLITANLRLSIIAAILYVGFAAPQIVHTLLGLLGDDEFLNYRQASTDELGVNLGVAILCAIPVLLFVAVCLFTLKQFPNSGFTSLFIALGIGAAIMTTNDLWGFNQEPYRFWLQYLIMAGFLTSIVLAWSITKWRTADLRKILIPLVAVAVTIWVVSLLDFWEFRGYASDQGVIETTDSRAQALRDLVPTDQGLILSSRCVDPQVLRLITTAPVAYFNYGLAWPDNRNEIPSSNQPDLQASGVTYAITDSACEQDWEFTETEIQALDVGTYDGGFLTLWKLPN